MVTQQALTAPLGMHTGDLFLGLKVFCCCFFFFPSSLYKSFSISRGAHGWAGWGPVQTDLVGDIIQGVGSGWVVWFSDLIQALSIVSPIA